jgi:hypothetical protein
MKSLKVLALVAALAAPACSSTDRPQAPAGQPDPAGRTDAGQPDSEQPDSGPPDSTGPEGQPLPGMSNVRGAPDQSVKASIGPEGGKLETSHAGTTYTLTVPPGALADAVEITLIPVVALPGVERMAGGWHALPEGLTFLEPATLDVRFGTNAPSDAIGFAYAGDGMDLHEYPVEVRADGFTFPVLHFSGGGTGGSVAGNATSAEAAAMQAIAREIKKASPSADAVASALGKWYSDAIGPGLAIAAKDPDPMRYVDAYTRWRNACEGLLIKPALAIAVLAMMRPAITAADAAAASVFKDLIAQENAECATQQNFQYGERALLWQRKADTLDLATADFGLNLESILPDLCIQISFEELSFPQSIRDGESGTLGVKVGYTLGEGEARFDRPIKLTVTSSGTGSDGTSTLTPDAEGKASLSVVKNTSGELSLIGEACLVSPREICQPFSVVRGNGGKTFAEFAAIEWFQAGGAGDGNGDWIISLRDLGDKYLFRIERDPHNGFTYLYHYVDITTHTATSFSGTTTRTEGLDNRIDAAFSEEADGPHLRGTVTIVHTFDMPPAVYDFNLNAVPRTTP